VQTISISLLVLNSLLWVVFSIVYFFNYSNWLGMINFAMGSLLLLDAFLYLIVAWGIFKKIKLLYYFGLFLILGNIVLVIVDELGLVDFAVLTLNLAILISLILLKRKPKLFNLAK